MASSVVDGGGGEDEMKNQTESQRGIYITINHMQTSIVSYGLAWHSLMFVPLGIMHRSYCWIRAIHPGPAY